MWPAGPELRAAAAITAASRLGLEGIQAFADCLSLTCKGSLMQLPQQMPVKERWPAVAYQRERRKRYLLAGRCQAARR